MASIDWGCAVQVMAAASIGSNEVFSATNGQTLCVSSSFSSLADRRLIFMKCGIRCDRPHACCDLLPWDTDPCPPPNSICRTERLVSSPNEISISTADLLQAVSRSHHRFTCRHTQRVHERREIRIGELHKYKWLAGGVCVHPEFPCATLDNLCVLHPQHISKDPGSLTEPYEQARLTLACTLVKKQPMQRQQFLGRLLVLFPLQEF